jgi:hypothetical protein
VNEAACVLKVRRAKAQELSMDHAEEIGRPKYKDCLFEDENGFALSRARSRFNI